MRGQFTTFWQIPTEKNNYNYVKGQFTTYWQIPAEKIITFMWEGNLLPFDRFQKKTLQLCDGANYFQMTNSRKKNYNYARGQITTKWQIPDKKNNYNYVGGQFIIYWQIPAKKNNYNYVKGQFTTFWMIPDKKNDCNYVRGTIYYLSSDFSRKKELQLRARAIYYLLTDSTQKNNYNYVRGQFTTFWQIPEKNNTIMREGKLLPNERFENKKLQSCERAIYYLLIDSRQKK